MVVVVAGSGCGGGGGGHLLYTLLYAEASLENQPGIYNTRYQKTSSPPPPTDQQQQQHQKLVAGDEGAVVVVAAAGCGGGGDGHLYVAVLLAKFYLFIARTWYQVKGFCTDAHRLTMKAISQDYCTTIGLTECIRFNKLG